MQMNEQKAPIMVDDSIPEANALGDRVTPCGITLRQELVRDYMKALLAMSLPFGATEDDRYDDIVSVCMTDAARRANLTLLIMVTARPLELAPAEDSPIVSPEAAIIVRGH